MINNIRMGRGSNAWSEPCHHQLKQNKNPLSQKIRGQLNPYLPKQYIWKYVQMSIKDAERTLEQQEKTLQEIQKKLRTVRKQQEQLEEQQSAYVIKLKKIEVRLQKEVDEMVIIDLKQQSILIDRKLQNLREQILELKAKIQQLKANAMFWKGLINQTQQYIRLKSVYLQKERFPISAHKAKTNDQNQK